MNAHRKQWNNQQTEFRQILLSFDQHEKAIHLFLSQHAAVHSAKMLQIEPAVQEDPDHQGWSFEDELLDDMAEEQIRRIPNNCDHSVAWLIWHMARIEDTTMNMLVAGSPQILHGDDWLEQMNITVHNTGNAMDEAEVANLSTTIDIEALRAYRLAVGRRTREIVKQLRPDELKQKVDLRRLQQVLDEGTVVEDARGLIDYWSKRNIAELLLMPPTRHNFIHLNEGMRLKQRRQ